MMSRRLLLLKSGTCSISKGRNRLTSTSRMWSNTNVNCTWRNHWLYHNARSLLPTTPRTVDLPLQLADGQQSLSVEILDYVTFAPIMQLKMRHISCWNVPYISRLEISSHHLVPWILKSFFQLHQIDNSLYFTEATALHHSKILTSLKASWRTFSPISLFGFPDFKINFISLMSGKEWVVHDRWLDWWLLLPFSPSSAPNSL